MACFIKPLDGVLWPSWSGNLVKSNVPCPSCKSKTTMNFSGTLNPDGWCSYMCDCGIHFDIHNKSGEITVRHVEVNN